MISKASVKDLYPLSPMQEGMLFHALEDPASRAYFEQVSYRVSGSLDLGLFEETWNYLFERHDILRTAFLHERTKRPLQAVLKERKLPFVQFDLRHLGIPAQAASITEHRAEEKRRGFDLRSDVLLRARVLTMAHDGHEIILSFHHILMDGWCMGILHTEFLRVYQALEAGESPSLPPAVPYGRYIQWLEQQDKEAALGYWGSCLEGYATPSLLPGRRQHSPEYELRRLNTALDSETSKRLRTTASDWGVTINTLFQTAWAIVLGRYVCSNDVIFGAVVSGRPAEIPEVESILGLFINLVPVRARLDPDQEGRELAASLHAAFLDSAPFSYCPFSDLAAKSSLPQKLLDHILVFENYPDSAGVTTGLLTIQRTDQFEQTNYDFVIVISPGESIDIAFHFNASAFDADYMSRLQWNYLDTLNRLLSNPLVRDLAGVSTAESRLLEEYNATTRFHTETQGIMCLFDGITASMPDAVSIVDADDRWSYAEIGERANGVAAMLRSVYVIGQEDRVAVLIPRSRWLPLALLGTLRAGAVYVPIDVSDPPERIRFIIEDAGCCAVLVSTLPAFSLPVPVVDVSAVPRSKGDAPALSEDSDRLAYLIYTSGSTGLPKGVMVSHRSALNLVRWHQREFSVGGKSCATLFASPAFDASIWEMLPYLLSGGSIHVVPEEARLDAEMLTRFLVDREITHSFVPPPVCEEIGRVHNGRLNGRVQLLTGGDVLRGMEGLEGIAVNNYGPTESAVVATSTPIDSSDTRIPIGRPIDNTEILILDPLGRPVPIGVTGELHIASRSLARGYWKRPGLTAGRFLPHPWRHSARMYRTGDLGYWRDGAIVFCGRNDHQVKVLGVRIELSEVENVLEQYPQVIEAVAGVTEDAGNLIAWVVPATGSIDLPELRRFAARRLPRAMTPARFVPLQVLPRTRNGKVDRSALPDPDQFAAPREAMTVLPSTPAQQELAAIWSSVLNVPEIGIHDNFFEMGGHSLSVTRAVSQIRDRLQVKIPLRAVFEAPTIARLEEVIEQLRNTTPEAGDEDEPPLVARRRVLAT